MEIFIFQIAIIAVIFLSAFFGREVLNITVLIVSVFTLLAVFMTWLIILQFITIVISYFLAVPQINRQEQITERQFNYRQNNAESGSSNNSGCFSPLKLIMIALCIYFAYSVWSNKNTTSKNIETEIVEQPQQYNSPNNFNVDTLSVGFSHGNIEDSVENSNTQLYYEEQELEANIITEQESYDQWDGDKDEYSYGGKVRFGNFKFLEDRNCSISTGILEIKNINNRKINFSLKVSNHLSSGEIAGVAYLTADYSRAIYKSYDCKSIIFDFLTDGKIQISEISCDNYHGNKICFDSEFE